jgi:hypothetical protein
MSVYQKLPCNTIVYRAMRNRSWINRGEGVVSPAAFVRRSSDTDGLSVNLATVCTIEDVRKKLTTCHGVISLHTGRIRDITLDIQQDSYDHANIVGVPYQHENPVEAERLAGLLAKQSRIQWLP